MAKQKFNRRQFVKLAGASSAAIPLASLTGCGTPDAKNETGRQEKATDARGYNDRSFPKGFVPQVMNWLPTGMSMILTG